MKYLNNFSFYSIITVPLGYIFKATLANPTPLMLLFAFFCLIVGIVGVWGCMIINKAEHFGFAAITNAWADYFKAKLQPPPKKPTKRNIRSKPKDQSG